MNSTPLRRRAAGLATGIASTVHVAFTMARRGLLTPGRPDRVVAQLWSLMRWGVGLAGGFGSAARRDPDRTAVIDAAGAASFAELDRRADRLAVGFDAHLESTNLNVGVLCRNHMQMVETLIACAKLGCDAVLLNTAMPAAQTLHAASRHDVGLLVADAEFAHDLHACGQNVPPVVTAWPRRSLESGSRSCLDAMVADSAPTVLSPPPRPGRTVVLTSGTTSAPKGASRPQPHLRALTAVLSRIPLRVGDRALIAAPLFHTWGHAAMQLSTALRATMVLPQQLDPETVLRQLADNRCTAWFTVPIVLQRVLDLPDHVKRRHDTSALRVTVVSGSRLSGDLALRFMDAFGDVLYNLYGATEVSWVSIATPSQLRRRPDTAGRPPYGTTVTLRDEAGRAVADEQTGRIFVCNDMLFSGYTDGSRRELHDGAMDTGDLGRVEDGLLFVDGRSDDMIVSGGENVFPKPVEDLVTGLPHVREAAVVGVPDAEFGQRLAAYVVLHDDAQLDGDAVRDHVRRHAARHCVPRDVSFLAELPRNAAGKVVARRLPTA